MVRTHPGALCGDVSESRPIPGMLSMPAVCSRGHPGKRRGISRCSRAAWPFTVEVAQLVEPRLVEPAVAGSSPVFHPIQEVSRKWWRSGFENREPLPAWGFESLHFRKYEYESP